MDARQDVGAGGGHRFVALDGLRGVAALAVAILHIQQMVFPQAPILLPASLAVDFFFILSGFVLAYAYFDRLDGGLTWRTFMIARLIRLYPLIPIGVLLGAAISLAKQHVQGVEVPGESWFDVPLMLFLIPSGLFAPRPAPNFGFDAPLWSLLFEFMASAFFATRLRRMRGSALIAFMITAAFLDAAAQAVRVTGFIERGGLLALLVNVPRTAFAFALGVIIFRSGIWRRVPHVPILPIGLLLGVVLLIPGENSALYGVLILFLVFPAIVAVGAQASPRRQIAKLCRWFGDLSYPLYVLHFPVARGMIYALKFLVPDPIFLIVAGLGSAIAASCVALKLYDEPMRRWLRHISRKPSGQTVLVPEAPF